MRELAREVLAGEEAWVVGGAVRDELLGRPVLDLDIATREPERAARAYASQAGAAHHRTHDRRAGITGAALQPRSLAGANGQRQRAAQHLAGTGFGHGRRSHGEIRLLQRPGGQSGNHQLTVLGHGGSFPRSNSRCGAKFHTRG